MNKPDFFIVGAPKCGTTAMYHFLRQHPAIFMPVVKEPHFFAPDVHPRAPIRDEAAYWALFDTAVPTQKIGEASATYLYSRQAAANIKQCCPSAKIIIMLRHPVDVMVSLHQQRLYNGVERIQDFSAALQQEDARKQGRAPASGAFPFYRAAVAFCEQIKRYDALFDRADMQFILHDDLRADAASVYRQTLRFLAVDDTFQPDFRVWNAGRQIRSPQVQRLIKESALRRLVRRAMPLVWRQKLVAFIERKNVGGVYAPLPPALRWQLQREFAGEITCLERLIGRDLSHWQRPAAAKERGTA